MRRLSVVLAFLVLTFPAVTHAQAPGGEGVPQNTTPAGGTTPGSTAGTVVGGDVPSQGAPTAAPVPVPATRAPVPAPMAPKPAPSTGHRPAKRKPVYKRTCKTRRRVRTCKTYRDRRLVKVCTKRPGIRQRCRAVRASAAARGPRAQSSALVTQGYQTPLLPAVGRFYQGDRGWCTGTMIYSGIVLTAAHCLYDRSKGQYYDLSFVPGNTWDGARGIAPYGIWAKQTSYVTQGYVDGDASTDWGLFILRPDASGRYAGDYTGTFASYGGVSLSADHVIYREGYPAERLWNTAARFFGNGNYLCAENFQQLERSSTGHLWMRFFNFCPMNGGSSGGPNFVQLADGTFGVVAVNNLAARNVNSGDGDNASNTWFDQDYVTFVRTVRAMLEGRSARAGSTALVAPH